MDIEFTEEIIELINEYFKAKDNAYPYYDTDGVEVVCEAEATLIEEDKVK